MWNRQGYHPKAKGEVTNFVKTRKGGQDAGGVVVTNNMKELAISVPAFAILPLSILHARSLYL